MASIETWPGPDISAPREDKWKREQRAFRQLLPELRLAHPDEFVAIHEGQVVGSGVDKIEVARQAYERFGYIPISVSRVVAGPLSPIRIPSPRRFDGSTG
jgi:hypothetical protein